MTVTVDATTPTPAAAPVEALIALTKLSVAPETVRRTDRRGAWRAWPRTSPARACCRTLCLRPNPVPAQLASGAPAASRARRVALL